jgi:TolB-like protein
MSDVFISYARSTAREAKAVAEALRGLGYSVWIDDDLPAHRTYSRVIEEQMMAAKAAVVIWSADAVQSEWVLSEANRAREDHKLVQVTTDRARLPMPFDTIQCADLAGWSGDMDAPGWRKVVASIADLVGGLAAASSVSDAPPPLPSKPSIAVMPFANLSGDPEQEYFADGMVEEIITALSRFKSIFVIGSGSTLSFKGKSVSPHEAGRQLGVRYVLEGSVRRAGARVRITAKLTDAEGGAQIWADRFEDTLDDIFALQDRVALSVGGVIEPAVRTAEVRRTARRPTENLGSYDLYLRASGDFLSFVPEKALASLALMERAIELDPDFGPAMARAGQLCSFVFSFGWSDDPRAYRRRGIALAHRAIEVAGDDADVLVTAASTIQTLERNLDSATTLIDRALELNPGASVVWYYSGMLQIALGEPDLAVQHLETARRLDPLSAMLPAQRQWTAIARFQQGRFAETVQLLSEIVRHVTSPLTPAFLAAAYGQLGMKSEAEGALALYREWTSTPIKLLARGRPEHIKLFLDGIAVAEGRADAASADSTL